MSKMCEIEIHSFPLGFDPETGIQSKPAPVGSAIWIKFPYNLGWKQSEERSGLNTAKNLKELLTEEERPYGPHGWSDGHE